MSTSRKRTPGGERPRYELKPQPVWTPPIREKIIIDPRFLYSVKSIGADNGILCYVAWFDDELEFVAFARIDQTSEMVARGTNVWGFNYRRALDYTTKTTTLAPGYEAMEVYEEQPDAVPLRNKPANVDESNPYSAETINAQSVVDARTELEKLMEKISPKMKEFITDQPIAPVALTENEF